MFVLSGFLGAFLGATLAFAFNIWKVHRDERTSRCDELCKAILDASHTASSYWASTFEKKASEQSTKEAHLLASQTIIDGLAADFRQSLRVNDDHEVDRRLSELFDLLTGGDFSVPERKTDLSRATRVLPVAGDVAVQLRRAHRETMPFYGFNRAYHENKRRKLDMPVGWEAGS